MNEQKTDQLDLFAGLESKDLVRQRMVELLQRQLYTLRYLKVCSMLCEPLPEKETIYAIIESMIELTCRAFNELDDAERDVEALIADQIRVEPIAYIPTEFHRILAQVKSFKQPRSKMYDFNIDSYQDKIDDLHIELKVLFDDLHTGEGSDSI